MPSALLAPDTFEFFARYLLAGYIVIIVRARFVAGLRPKPSELIVEAIIFSLILQLFALGLFWSLSGIGATALFRQWVSNAESLSNTRFFIELLVLPSLFGWIIGRSLSAGWKNALLRRLSIPVIHPSRTGYDFWFGNAPDASILVITYEDGTCVSGFFGEESLASSNPEPRDIYLEFLYTQDENGTFVEPTTKRAAILSLNGVRSIEIIKVE